jgi:hypothetical protein
MLDGRPVMAVGSPSRRSESPFGAWLHGLALGHLRWQGMKMQSILPLYLLVNTATIIILSDNSLLFTLAQSVASFATPIFDFKSEATSSSSSASSSSLPFPAKLVANICFER